MVGPQGVSWLLQPVSNNPIDWDGQQQFTGREGGGAQDLLVEFGASSGKVVSLETEGGRGVPITLKEPIGCSEGSGDPVPCPAPHN